MPTCITRRPRQPPERWAFSGPGDFEPILAQLGANGGAIFNADAFINNMLAVDLSERYRVRAIYGGGGSAAKSGMITYNLDILAQVRQTAPYLDRILKGEKPADLPVVPIRHQSQGREGT